MILTLQHAWESPGELGSVHQAIAGFLIQKYQGRGPKMCISNILSRDGDHTVIYSTLYIVRINKVVYLNMFISHNTAI